ncbi:MAG: aldehyde dehydrogenase family protein [Sphingopyxis sp.]|nr:aldehyde dehydrogenase family protein [Sphingopyxis sp.]
MQMLTVYAPFDNQPIGDVAYSSPSEIEAALATADALFRRRSAWLGKIERIAILRRFETLVAARHEELALQVARESGKPLRDARTEIDRGLECVAIAIEELRTNAGHVVPMGLNATSADRVAFTQYEPIGVVLAISAFNHPFNLVIHQLVPAIAVGAPVIVKPSPKTPLSCRAIIAMLAEAGLPDGWAQMVLPSSNEEVAAIVADRRIAFLSFIGSAAVGWQLRALLPAGARCALEHGGVAPVIVAADADLDAAIPRIARAGFWHAGQACVSVQRLFCDAGIATEVADRIAAFGDALVTGDPALATTDVGPLISGEALARVDAWVGEAAAAGGQLVTGGRALSPTCYANTVLLNPPEDSKVATSEIFGPAIAVFPFADLDEAIGRTNSLPFAFQAAAFTRNLDTAMRCYRRIDASAVMINETSLFRTDWMPFAGLRASGLGVGGIPHTMRELQVEKMMVWRSDLYADGAAR